MQLTFASSHIIQTRNLRGRPHSAIYDGSRENLIAIGHSDRDALLKALRKLGTTEINGISGGTAKGVGALPATADVILARLEG